MPLNAVAADPAFPDRCRLDKPNATSFTVQVGNQTCSYQVNTAPFGRGENWMPANPAQLVPGIWNFGPSDWAEYGVRAVQGIRFLSVKASDPSIITVS